MSQRLNFDPRSVANSSGFPLQIRIAEVAKSSPTWKVYKEEHPWHSFYDQSEGFIDLAIIDRNDTQVMVVECKRVKQAVWVFLVPNPDPKTKSYLELWVSDHNNIKWNYFGWKDFRAEPCCHESKYCAIPGQDHGRRNLLERTASELMDSMEAFALQEKELEEKKSSEFSFRRIYIPVIVTTAELQIACFKPDSISLKDGTLSKDTNFTSVPYIRFRKAFSSRIDLSLQQSFPTIFRTNERTVFIVNAEKFGEFLNTWELLI